MDVQGWALMDPFGTTSAISAAGLLSRSLSPCLVGLARDRWRLGSLLSFEPDSTALSDRGAPNAPTRLVSWYHPRMRAIQCFLEFRIDGRCNDRKPIKQLEICPLHERVRGGPTLGDDPAEWVNTGVLLRSPDIQVLESLSHFKYPGQQRMLVFKIGEQQYRISEPVFSPDRGGYCIPGDAVLAGRSPAS